MNNKIDLLVSFDTTGSMYPVLSQVRQQVQEFIHSMFSEFGDLRLAVIAHGDYCDKDHPYTIRIMDFTKDENSLCDFIRTTEKTNGGDSDECYELVLNQAYSAINWRADADKMFILIGDASPHSVSYGDNKGRLDWKNEAAELGRNGIKVFAVHALSYYRNSSKAFYQAVADSTLGVYLTLDQFSEVKDLIKAACAQQVGEEKLSEFVSIIRESGRMTHTMDNNIKRLKGETVETYYDTPRKIVSTSKHRDSHAPIVILDKADLEPVKPGRFQTMIVDKDTVIKEFITNNGIEFKKGRGFYELTKHETVQQYKEIIMQDRETGEMFTGKQVRERLNLQPQCESGGAHESLSSRDTEAFRVFVQSTSVNRKLIAGTTLLYEISDIDDTGSVADKVSDKKAKVDKPVAKVSEKKAKVVKPVAKVSEKKAKVVKPVAKVSEKKAKVAKPVAKVIEKKAKVAKPVAKVIEKKAKVAKPVAKVIEKKAKVAKPVAKVIEKKAKVAKPVAKVIEKKAKVAKPVAKVIEKKAKVAKPVAKVIEKKAKVAKPVAKVKKDTKDNNELLKNKVIEAGAMIQKWEDESTKRNFNSALSKIVEVSKLILDSNK